MTFIGSLLQIYLQGRGEQFTQQCGKHAAVAAAVIFNDLTVVNALLYSIVT